MAGGARVNTGLGLGWAIALGGISPAALASLGTAPSIPTESAPSPQQIQADTLFRQGLDQYRANQIEAAIALWQDALNLYRTLGATAQERSTLGNIGAAHLALGHYAEAIGWLEQFRQLAEAEANPTAQAQALGNLGIAYRGLGDYDQAIAVNQQALTLMQSLDNRQGEGQLLSNLGNLYETLGDYDNALAAYQQSLAITRELDDQEGEAIVLANLGAIYATLGNYSDAIATYEQSLRLTQSLGDRRSEGHTRLNLGSAYAALDHSDRALDYYQQSLDLARQTGDRALEGRALGSLGMVFARQGQYDQALNYQHQSLEIMQTTGSLREQAIALNNLGHTQFGANQLTEAEATLEQAIELWDALRASDLSDIYTVSVFDTQVFSYNLLKQILVAQGKIEEALEVAEQGRARALVSLLLRRNQNSDFIPDETPDIDQIRQIAQEQNATLVEYAIIPDDDFQFQGKQRGRERELFIWVISPTGSVEFRRVDLRSQLDDPDMTLSDLVGFTRASLGVRGIAVEPIAPNPRLSRTRRLRELHQILIDPIADLLPTDPQDRVILIPQESLFVVPFAAIQDDQGNYLIQNHTLLIAPSIQVLALAGTHNPFQSHASQPLIVGNPEMPVVETSDGLTQQLNPLPGAEQEAIAIAEFLHTESLIGSAATETTVRDRLSTASIIHLATHGLLDYATTDANTPSRWNVPGESLRIPGAIALTSTDTDDGLLTSDEIVAQPLTASLVVLSACDTGRGQITGDGVMGLSRSFLAAGASSVVMSLWAVPDTPTALLMTEFYRNLEQDMDKAQALRHATLTLMEQYPDPVDWAAFTLMGRADW